MNAWRAMALAAIVMTGMSSRADAVQLQCAAPAEVLKNAKDAYGEEPMLAGMIVGGSEVTILISPKGSWTMVMVHGADLCVLAVGAAMKPAEPAPETQSLPAAPALLEHGLLLIRQ